MPTYNIFTSPGKLTLAQKEEIARVCTEVYHEEFGIARYLIQVVFYEVANNDRYIGAKPVQPDLVWIRCDVREGRTPEMKARLLHRVQQGIAKAANISEEAVWFYLDDLASVNIMEWGHIMPHLGAVSDDRALPQDQPWFAELSAPMQASLRQLA